jgi:hypothetical protein
MVQFKKVEDYSPIISSMRFKTVDGVLYATADYSTARGYQLAQKVERFTQKYLKFFLGVALTVLALAWASAVQEILHTIAFAQFLHAQ